MKPSPLPDKSVDNNTANDRPLSGIKVIDFGHYIAGPAAAMMLADFGAQVIRVDHPQGDQWASPAARMLNRGKRSIALDLNKTQDLQLAQNLVASADVVIENFRPGVMKRFGLDAQSLTKACPQLVYLSLPGFASTDSALAPIPAWEGIVASVCGQCTDMGLNRILMGINPSFSPLPLASAYASVLGSMSVLFALFKRRSTGLGEAIEVPLASALMEGLAYNSQYIQDYPERYKGHREKEIERRRARNLPMDMDYQTLQEYLDPFYRNYRCKDGRNFYVVSASHKDHPVRILKLMGLWDQLQAQGLPQFSAYLDSSRWPDGMDSTLSNYPLSRKWSAIISARLKTVFLTKTAADWERLFAQIGAPGAMQRSSEEWLNSTHAQASGLVLEVEDQVFGPMLQLGNIAWLKSDRQSTIKTSAPLLDQHRQAIIDDLQQRVNTDLKDDLKLKDGIESPPATAEKSPQDNQGWLQGIKVLDLTNVIAGPTVAATMARFGAEVISIGPVEPSMDPWNTIVFGMHANQGKRSLLMDLKAPQARPILDRLIAQCDVITVNALDRQLEALGLDHARLTSINPKIILCQLDCYGGPHTGPRTDSPGYDDLAQASTGVMLRFGGSMDTPEEHAHFGTIDVLGGFSAALAVGAALYRREVTGKGDVARSSLCAAGNLIQAPFMYDYANRDEFDEPSGRAARGYHALYRAYQAQDGWFFVAAKLSQQSSLSAIEALRQGAGLSLPELESFLADAFIHKPVRHWVAQLLAQDIGAQPLGEMQRIRQAFVHEHGKDHIDLSRQTFSFVRHQDHPSGHSVDLVAPNAIRPQNSGIRVPVEAPKHGAHSEQILSELGLDDQQIKALIAHGVVGCRWSEQYLPN